jgi:hypothetical protein
MGNNVIQFYNPEDGYTYFYDFDREHYGKRKICDLAYSDLPQSVKLQVQAVRQEAERTLLLPTE